ncbi:GNAT family N-acetyltransferase [Alkaliphilus oremlandii]|uniref:GCN5-related N-acetyltransferase n=1 Tax=Alkaliphilus oremlandii (strain OhILAs) TaxID=350688 RepID=A8MIF0_ALKOO|nr:GNAT family N-acetyltransferase [Alkaliphilus oremlandii]ABW19582.1 GCN5-related N-acetyltransferase [Alkaliphilus oremlandii OhILAs]
MTKITNDLKMVPLRDQPELLEKAVLWFSSKWGIPAEAYRESISKCIENPKEVPQWYVVLGEMDNIAAGLGMIENDFHKRTDLTPNVCAVYVEPQYRNNGIAGAMLDFVRRDAFNCGLETLYLLTGHDQLYEKFGWKFLCTVECDDGEEGRMYVMETLEK